MINLHKHVCRFFRDRRGVAGIEMALIAPVLISLIFTAFAVFGLVKSSYVAEKATFTIGDVISRQTSASTVFLGQMKSTLIKLAPSAVEEPQLRITSFIRNANGFAAEWTYNSKSGGALSQRPVPIGQLPDIAINDSVLLTETLVKSKSVFNLLPLAHNGIATFENVAVTRPRFVGRVVKVN